MSQKMWYMSRFGTIKEIFQLYIKKRKFYMFPVIILLIVLIGVTSLAQSGLLPQAILRLLHAPNR